jgi:probable rRNA maturation factor
MPPRPVPIHLLPGTRGRITAAELRRVARHVLAAEAVAPQVQVEIVLADSGTVQNLNRLYRGQDQPTDVLSFAQTGAEPPLTGVSLAHPEPVEGPGVTSITGAFIEPPDTPPSLGEIVICVPVVEEQIRARNAQQAALAEAASGSGRRFQIDAQIAHLLVHGLLHLLAYDHEASEQEADRMQAREDDLLSALGYAGAYEHGH